jgi:hypothetical protein
MRFKGMIKVNNKIKVTVPSTLQINNKGLICKV